MLPRRPGEDRGGRVRRGDRVHRRRSPCVPRHRAHRAGRCHVPHGHRLQRPQGADRRVGAEQGDGPNNTVVFGSVNAGRRHYEQAAEALARADAKWLDRLITRRVPLDRWEEAARASARRREDRHHLRGGLVTEEPSDPIERQGARADVELGSIQVLEGSTFMVSDARGDVRDGTVAGLYHEDTRHLNRFELTVGGASPTLLTSNEVDYYSAAFFLTNAETVPCCRRRWPCSDTGSSATGSARRSRVRNHNQEPLEVELRLACGSRLRGPVRGQAGRVRQGRPDHHRSRFRARPSPLLVRARDVRGGHPDHVRRRAGRGR